VYLIQVPESYDNTVLKYLLGFYDFMEAFLLLSDLSELCGESCFARRNQARLGL
jgi:hypothetical protein